MASQDNKKAQGLPKPYGLPNPYAQGGLPNPYASATVASAAPVRWTEEQARAEQMKKTASHFHNPHNIKRPQAKKSGPAKKPTMPVVSVTAQDASRVANPQQHGIEYYRSTADDDASFLEERRQRQYDERQRKKEQKKFQKQHGYWNPTAPLKPERYSNLKAYRASGGYARKKQDFDAYLQQAAKKKSRETTEATNSSRPASSSSDQMPPPAMKKPSFAPAASYDPATVSQPADMQAEEDPYARRMRLSQQQQQQQQGHAPPPPPPAASSAAPPPPPPAPTTSSGAVYQGATISGPPVRYANATISAPPVRYEHPDLPMGDFDEPTYNERPAKRPKISKAEAMMAKMGYVKGQGLGKNNDGVVTHLEVKKRKEQQKGNAFDQDGGKVKSQLVWDVHGGVRTQQDEPGKYGEESTVVVAWGCIDGIDWDENAQRNDGGIRQDLGEILGAKFGHVQQVQIDESNKDGVVYIKFESVMSALNAVNRFDEGYELQGRKIRAHFYDEKKWHAGIWDH